MNTNRSQEKRNLRDKLWAIPEARKELAASSTGAMPYLRRLAKKYQIK